MRTRLAETTFWLGLIVWISALVTAGVSAAMAFPTMREFSVVVPKFAAHDEAEHWSIAAGLLMERIFFVTDVGQMLASLLAVIGLGTGYVLRARKFRQPIEMLRTLCIAGAALLLAYRVFLLAPDMNGELQRYWNAAEQGSTELADRHRSEFQSLHPMASRVYGVMLVLLLGAAGATAWTPPVMSARGTHELQEPALARNASR